MPEKPDNAEPRRRWHQFSLRTLLIGVALLGVACAYLAHEAKIVQARKAWLDDRPFWVAIQCTTVNNRNPSADPTLIRRLLGDEAVERFIMSRHDDVSGAKALFPEARISVCH